MAYRVYNFTDNRNVETIAQMGQFSVIQWDRDLSVSPSSAQTAYFSAEMNVRRRQLICNLAQGAIILQAGEMQWTVGDVTQTTGVQGAGDLLKKFARSTVSKESIIKPKYTGTGLLITEPTWHFILLFDMAQWNGSVVLDDGLFLACDAGIRESLERRTTLSSAVAGNEGLFNLKLSGQGTFALESPCPREEIIVVDLEDDEIKIDGNYALAWSPSLAFTVERSGKSLIGSAASGEGLVNVYRGTGRVIMAPMQPSTRSAAASAVKSTD